MLHYAAQVLSEKRGHAASARMTLPHARSSPSVLMMAKLQTVRRSAFLRSSDNQEVIEVNRPLSAGRLVFGSCPRPEGSLPDDTVRPLQLNGPVVWSAFKVWFGAL